MPSTGGRSEKDRRMMAWLKRARSTGTHGDQVEAPKLPCFAVTAEYRSLHKYLDDRFADTVVLTFAEIEDLLGFALPVVARLERDWWTSRAGDRTPSAQSRSWTQASRTAVPNLVAQTVVFERASG